MDASYKIVLVGDSGVGKSTFLKRHLTGEFETKHIPTMGVSVHPLTFHTNHGEIKFKVWDCAGLDQYAGLQNGYYLGAQGVICMFDLSNNITEKSVPHWIEKVRIVVPAIPVICGNKCDIQDRRNVKPGPVSSFKYFDISAKSNYNYDKPFLELARQLTGHQDLTFLESPPIFPHEVKIKTPSPKKVCLMSVPGGVMKITYEFYRDGEVIEQEGTW